MNLGNVRAGGAFSGGNVTVTNTAAADGYSDDLGVSLGAANGGFALSGDVSVIAAGGNRALGIGYVGSTTTAGLKSGTLTVGMVSKGQSGTGLADVSLSPVTVDVSATVYRPAVGVLGATALDLGSVREGESFVAGSLSVTNNVVADGFSEKLNASLGPVYRDWETVCVMMLRLVVVRVFMLVV